MGTLFVGLAAIASALISGIISSNESDVARQEARKLSERARQDQLRQQQENNKLAKRELLSGQQQIDFERGMFEKEQQRSTEDFQRAQQATRGNYLLQSANRLREQPERSFLFKNNNPLR